MQRTERKVQRRRPVEWLKEKGRRVYLRELRRWNCLQEDWHQHQ